MFTVADLVSLNTLNPENPRIANFNSWCQSAWHGALSLTYLDIL